MPFIWSRKFRTPQQLVEIPEVVAEVTIPEVEPEVIVEKVEPEVIAEEEEEEETE